MVKIKFVNQISFDSETIIIGINDYATFNISEMGFSKNTEENIINSISKFEFNKNKKNIEIINTDCESKNKRIVVMDIKNSSNAAKCETSGAKILSGIERLSDINTDIIIQDAFDDNTGKRIAQIASGVLLKSWEFTKYKTKKESKTFNVNLLTVEPKNASQEFQYFDAVSQGVFLSREIISEPPNVLYPLTFTKRIKELVEFGLNVKIMNEDEMKRLGFETLLSVGQGSEKESYLAIIEWKGAEASCNPIAFVGKGVCFDSGGINIKPSNGMEDMKWDMAGAGVVTGLMKTLALRKAKINAVGVLGLVENMPSGSAYRPSDVIKSLSGKTVEVLNTDAEGRLVLADALWYTQKEFDPLTIVDLATLTGAVIAALGNIYAGLFTNSKSLSKELYEAGKNTGEKVWELPLDKEYNKLLSSEIADMANISSKSGAGSITAAEFLKNFIIGNTPWAHIDIAGVTWNNQGTNMSKKGATAFGVRLLNEWINKHHEG